jgi:hypothetical protein
MKPNPRKYYITIESNIYSLTEKQWMKFKSILDEDGDKWDEALDYIKKVGRFILELDGIYRY